MLVIELKGIIEHRWTNLDKKCINGTVKDVYRKNSSYYISNPAECTEEKYNNKLKKAWSGLNSKLRMLYETKFLIAYDRKENFEYYIFRDQLDEITGNESKTLNIVIVTPNKEISATINAVQKIIRHKLYWKLKFTFLTPSKCNIYAYNHMENDIYGDKYLISTDIEKNSFMTRAERIKFFLTAIMLILSSYYLINEWKNLSNQSDKAEQNSVILLLNLPLATNIVASSILVILIDIIYLCIRSKLEKDTINIQNIQGVIESFDNSINYQQMSNFSDGLDEEIEIE
ncbi:MAG: hypothetical protein K0S34_1593 [Bacillales bacterium]|jgi:hypothetical protein|nr:hypothetical protein [Bacillales bacterium]